MARAEASRGEEPLLFFHPSFLPAQLAAGEVDRCYQESNLVLLQKAFGIRLGLQVAEIIVSHLVLHKLHSGCQTV